MPSFCELRFQRLEAAANVAQWIVGYDADRWIEATRGESGYKATPDDVKPQAYYEGIPEHLPATLSFPGAVTVATTAFFARTFPRTVCVSESSMVQPLAPGYIVGVR